MVRQFFVAGASFLNPRQGRKKLLVGREDHRGFRFPAFGVRRDASIVFAVQSQASERRQPTRRLRQSFKRERAWFHLLDCLLPFRAVGKSRDVRRLGTNSYGDVFDVCAVFAFSGEKFKDASASFAALSFGLSASFGDRLAGTLMSLNFGRSPALLAMAAAQKALQVEEMSQLLLKFFDVFSESFCVNKCVSHAQ
jgi:hypothetical protein